MNRSFANDWVLAAISSSAIVAFTPGLAWSDIVTDGTLGTNINPLSSGQFDITGGTRPSDGSNLFHSFSQFDLTPGQVANFEVPSNVINIINRVTGGAGSSIDGEIRALGDANLFLINPNGLTFGPNASLNMGRSFIGTTAGSLLFEDGSRFVIDSRQPVTTGAAPLSLTITPSSGDVLINDTSLNVNNFQSLAFVGRNVSLNGTILNAPIGNITLGALSPGDEAPITSVSDILIVNLPALPEIPSSDSSILTLDNSIVAANIPEGTSASIGSFGLIQLQANELIALDNRTELQAVSFGSGEAGGIVLSTDSSGVIDLNHGSRIFTTIEPGGEGIAGRPGLIRIETGILRMSNAAQLQTLVRDVDPNRPGRPVGIGDPGNIFIIANNGVELNDPGTGISSELVGQGLANSLIGSGGNILQILDGEVPEEDLFGSVLIRADGGNVVLSNGAQILTSTAGNGSAGAVWIVADNILVQSGSSIESNVERAGTGSAGIVLLEATNDVVVRGNQSRILSEIASGNNASFLMTEEQPGAIFIAARRVGALNGGFISADNGGSGVGGNVLIFANLIALNRSELRQNSLGGAARTGISAQNVSGLGGNILFVSQFLALANSSNVTTISGSETTPGSGGNIGLAVEYEIIGSPLRDNNILVDAFGAEGQGGIIEFVRGFTPFLRNIAIRDDVVVTNDISSAGRGGAVNGAVLGQFSETAVVQPATELPANPVDPSRLIADSCALGDLAAAQNIGELTLTGREGLATTPEEQLSSAPEISVLAVAAGTDSVQKPSVSGDVVAQNNVIPVHPTESTGGTFVEAQTWHYGKQGEIILLADAPDLGADQRVNGLSEMGCHVF